MVYAIKKQVLWKIVDDEVVIVDPEKEDYSYLNATGKDIWEMIDKGFEVETIVSELCGKYEASEDCIRGDVEVLIKELVETGLIVSK
jgi:hypothetical protein